MHALPALDHSPIAAALKSGQDMLDLVASTATHCPYCSLQCGMYLIDDEHGPLVAPRDFPTNQGGLCRKGWASVELLTHPDRLTTPLMRDRTGGDLRPVTWDVALDRIVGEIHAAQEHYGRDAVGIFAAAG
jgi:assimilatory nitrate reductase catalytic subunit